MSFLKLLGTECQKLKRSWILLLLFVPTVLTWIPSLLNADHAFQSATGAAPANEFFIQGFMGFTWFLFPACMVVCTVLIHQTELTNNGILKMLALPVRPAALSGAKFIILLGLGAIQVLLCDAVYYAVAAIASHTQDYDLILGPAAPTTAPRLGESLGDPIKMYLGDIYTISVNLAGLPGISVPCGLDGKGLPIGMQLIGRPFEEETILGAGYCFQNATDFHKQRPTVKE